MKSKKTCNLYMRNEIFHSQSQDGNNNKVASIVQLYLLYKDKITELDWIKCILKLTKFKNIIS